MPENIIVNPDITININNDTVKIDFPVSFCGISSTLSILFTYNQIREIIDHVYRGGFR